MSQPSDSHLRQRSPRLYPPRSNANFYVLTAIRKQLERLLAVYISSRPEATVVDYGCGDMPYRGLVEPRVAHYLSADLPGNDQAALTLNPDGSLPLDENTADAVISTQVLEHVEHPESYLHESFRVLKPNGLLILSTHGYWHYHPHPTDFWRWTSSGLSKIVQEAGFRVVELQGVMGLAPTALQLFQNALLRKSPSMLKPVLCLVMQTLIMLLDSLYTPERRHDDACVYIVVAVKP